MKKALPDIDNRQDIDFLLDKFYARMMDDYVIGFIFTHYAKLNLEKHLPIIADFWETILFHKPVYKRGSKAMDVHFDLNKIIPLKQQHFTRWLYLFHKTIDELYSGQTAIKAKERSRSIAKLMQDRLGTLPDCTEM